MRIEKDVRFSQKTISVIIIELDIPQLEAVLGGVSASKNVNLNDDLDVLLLYDGNPDSVYYATAFIYNSDV